MHPVRQIVFLFLRVSLEVCTLFVLADIEMFKSQNIKYHSLESNDRQGGLVSNPRSQSNFGPNRSFQIQQFCFIDINLTMIFWDHLGLQFTGFDAIFCPLEFYMTALLAHKYLISESMVQKSISNIGDYFDLLVKISASNSNDVVCLANK